MDANKTGILIANKRKEMGFNQAQLAERIHVSDKAVSRWETGRGFPDITILEDLADALQISVYELMKGEKDRDQERIKENEALAKDSLALFSENMNRKKVLSFLFGFFFSVAVLVLLLVHLNAPVYSENGADLVRVEKFDERLIAIIDASADGFRIEEVNYEGDKQIFIGVYQTAAGRFKTERREQIAILTEKGEEASVWSYPGKEGDVLLYGNASDQGVVTLPRLVYNYWIILSFAVTLISAVLYIFFRKKYFASRILDYVLIPSVSLCVSILLILWGNSGKVYNASYYLSGILLLAISLIFLYHFALKLFRRKRT